jgi:hypothetical protein
MFYLRTIKRVQKVVPTAKHNFIFCQNWRRKIKLFFAQKFLVEKCFTVGGVDDFKKAVGRKAGDEITGRCFEGTGRGKNLKKRRNYSIKTDRNHN